MNAYIAKTIEKVREAGYVSTIMGRRRPVPELGSSNHNTRLLGERLAINTPVQGSAADIIKIAMLKVQDALEAEGLQSRMILQVHDELLMEVPEHEAKQATALVVKGMEEAIELTVPLKVDHGIGKNWAEAH